MKKSSNHDRPFLMDVTLLREKVSSWNEYPFNLPVVKNLETLSLNRNVTFIIGENGTGKSTLLEAIATGMGFNPEGGSRNFRFSTRASHSELFRYLRLSRSTRRMRDGFFFRAESYFNVATEIERLDAEPAFGPPIISYFGNHSLHEQSHGESFLALFRNRLGGDGLYIVDEPEAALSPNRQLTLLVILHDLVKRGAQFMIATHSPIIMAYPRSRIVLLLNDSIEEVQYTETDHYLTTKSFVNDHVNMLKRLLEEDVL
jgi:predicted ATPase